jgi:integrase
VQSSQLTDQDIRRFAAPATVAAYHWDAGTKGFGVRVSPKGVKTFVVLIGSGRRQTLGRYPDLKLIDARKEAKRVLAEKTLGSVRPSHTAFDDVKKEYLDQSDARPRTKAEYTRLLTKHYPFGRKSIATITNRDIIAQLKGLPPSEKRHAFTVARAFFRYCLQNGYVEKNPIERVLVPVPGEPRERVLSPEELSQVWNSTKDSDRAFDAIVALLILTGQRRGEIAGLERSWVKGDLITLPASLTKNGREHTFPVCPTALAILKRQPVVKDSPYFFPAAKDRSRKSKATVFNNWGKSKAAFDVRTGVSGYSLHDLRRTFATGLAGLGTPIHVVEKLLNHVSGSFGGIVGVYQKYDFVPEMREATAKWELYLSNLPGTGTVPVAHGET